MSQSSRIVEVESQRQMAAAANRKRRKEAPLFCLEWPRGRAQAPQIEKKPRRVTFVASSVASNRKPSDTELWTVRYAPTSSAVLAVAPKKVQEIRDWMQRHKDYKEQQPSRPLNGSHAPPPMLILVGSPGIGKSAAVKCLAAEVEIELMEWTEGMVTTGNLTSSRSEEQFTTRTGIGVHSPLNAFEQYLKQCGSDLQPLMTLSQVPLPGESKSSRKVLHKLLLIDELPYTHTPDAQRALQSIFTHHVQRRSIPTIFIHSDAPEGKARTEDLQRYLHPQVFMPHPSTGPWCHIIAMHPPTKIKFRKVIQGIMLSEATSIASAKSSYVDELQERCGGDLRFAISTLQLEMIGDAFAAVHLANGSQNHQRLQPRDSKLSAFHALGKLLYAKRLSNKTSSATCERPPLELGPDSVMRQNDMELGNILHFLSFHCVDFYTDVQEVDTAMSYFSDVATLCDHAVAFGSSATSSSLTDVASAMSCRIVAHTNTHPAPFSFRPLGAPKVYDVLRKRQCNQERIRCRCYQYYSSAGGRTMDHHVNDRIFAVDMMPFLQAIIPSHEWSASTFLDSHFQNSTMTTRHNPCASYDNQESNEDMELWKEQLEILKEDDIVEDIDDGDDGW
jgi:cell cycle checkpoint protein